MKRAREVEKVIYCRCDLKYVRFKEQSDVDKNNIVGKTKGPPTTKQ